MPRFRLLQARAQDEPVREEERRSFAAKLGVPPERILPYDLLQGDTTFEHVIAGVDAVLVGGSGRYSIYDDTPWMTAFIDTLGVLADRDFPTFASCFGFQGFVIALGEVVAHDPEGTEVGTFRLELTPEGAEDPLFRRLPPTFNAQLGHKDRAFALPKGAAHLARSPRCPYQALRLGRFVYATQFHPELSGAENRARFKRYEQEYSKAFVSSSSGQSAQEVLDAFRPSPEATGLLHGFREVVLRDDT